MKLFVKGHVLANEEHGVRVCDIASVSCHGEFACSIMQISNNINTNMSEKYIVRDILFIFDDIHTYVNEFVGWCSGVQDSDINNMVKDFDKKNNTWCPLTDLFLDDRYCV